MENAPVVLGVAGIVVSGVVGPAVAAWFAQRARSREFHRQQIAHRRDQLRSLLDEAANLLASGPTHLRVLSEPGAEQGELERARTWSSLVFPLGQRLRLWLPDEHGVLVAYDRVRKELLAAAQAAPSDESALERFEEERRRFLDVSRETLLSPIPETGGGL